MMPQFDPSKMDPKVLMELSQLIQQLPPDKLTRMQSLMHNVMAGFDVSKEMEEFEKSLPPGFREKMMSLVASQMGTGAFGFPPPTMATSTGPGMTQASSAAPTPRPDIEVSSLSAGREEENLDVHGARMTVLRAVAEGTMSPEEAERILFSA